MDTLIPFPRPFVSPAVRAAQQLADRIEQASARRRAGEPVPTDPREARLWQLAELIETAISAARSTQRGSHAP